MAPSAGLLALLGAGFQPHIPLLEPVLEPCGPAPSPHSPNTTFRSVEVAAVNRFIFLGNVRVRPRAGRFFSSPGRGGGAGFWQRAALAQHFRMSKQLKVKGW